MAYGHADALIAVSNPLSRVIRKRFKYENIVVPNVIGGDVFFESIPRKHESFDFVFTGALTERKGIWDLLEAFASFYKAHADSHLHIIGDGTERLSIEKCVKNEKIEKAVTIYGRLNRSEISAVYSKCDCFVLPSRFETFGVVYIEALAAGLPVIGTKCGGPEDIIDESTGLLIECDDISGLINAMEYMYCNSENYNADELKQIVMKRYSESAIAESLIKIYENVLKR